MPEYAEYAKMREDGQKKVSGQRTQLPDRVKSMTLLLQERVL